MEKRRTDDEVHALPGMVPVDEDQLADIFFYQCKLMEKLGVPALGDSRKDSKIPVNDFTRMLTQFSQTCTTAINCEVTELLDALPWKPWKKSYTEIDLNNVHIEIVDILHFVIELAIIWGMTSKQLTDLYMKKMQENIDRQNKGY